MNNSERRANSALYAEAHNVANETGMWPLDMVECIKELEEALANVLVRVTVPCPGHAAIERAMNILNKKP